MIIEMDFGKAWSLQKTEKVVFIDVRSENEYELDHIPNAVNIPILNNELREKTGILYKQVGHEEARIYGFQQIAPILPKIVEQIIALSKEAKVVIYCWRGGMRSQAVAAVLDIMRVPVIRLNKGYKGYRNYINEFWQKPFPFPVVVLNGFTGVGKTKIINAISVMPHFANQTIDLEGLAGHRGSAFGAIGLMPQPSQKLFESRLWYATENFSYNKPVLVEGESKRIGNILIPDSLFNAMQKGSCIFAYDTIENRVLKIIEDYEPQKAPLAIVEAIERLKGSLGKEKTVSLAQSIKNGVYKPVVAMLLNDYYDPLYKHTKQRESNYNLKVDAANTEKAALVISEYLANQ